MKSITATYWQPLVLEIPINSLLHMHHGSKPQFAVGSLSVSLFTVQASPHRGPVLPITTNAPLATSWGFTRTPSSRRTGAVVNVTTPLTNGRWMVCLIYMQIPHRPHYTPAPPLERCPLPSTLHSAWQARSHWGYCARQPLRAVGSWSVAVTGAAFGGSFRICRRIIII